MNNDNKIWGYLLHLSFNMWEEYIYPKRPYTGYRPYLELDEAVWNDAINLLAEMGANMLVIDLGDAVLYKSHPEISVKNAWTHEKLQSELKRIRKLGMTPVPKMNFSAAHDTWLKDYSHMVSTDHYYQVCADLIQEVSELFGKPKLFHLGMDEEDVSNQKNYKYSVVRRNDLWWHDFLYLKAQVEKHGARAWIWPDNILWHDAAQFFERMPKSVLMSNWYYSEKFPEDNVRVKSFSDLEAHGYDQVPAACGKYFPKGIEKLVPFCRSHIDDSRLKGFLQTCWRRTTETYRDEIMTGIRELGEVIRKK